MPVAFIIIHANKENSSELLLVFEVNITIVFQVELVYIYLRHLQFLKLHCLYFKFFPNVIIACC